MNNLLFKKVINRGIIIENAELEITDALKRPKTNRTGTWKALAADWTSLMESPVKHFLSACLEHDVPSPSNPGMLREGEKWLYETHCSVLLLFKGYFKHGTCSFFIPKDWFIFRALFHISFFHSLFNIFFVLNVLSAFLWVCGCVIERLRGGLVVNLSCVLLSGYLQYLTCISKSSSPRPFISIGL